MSDGRSRPRPGSRLSGQNGGLSYREIARRLGISSSRVEQIEKEAIRKLREAADLRAFDEWIDPGA